MKAIELVDIESRKEKTELLLSHGKKVPRYIGDTGFEVALSLTREERKQFIDFLQKLIGKQLDPQSLPPNVLHKELWSMDLVDLVGKLFSPGILIKIAKLNKRLFELTDSLMVGEAIKENLLDKLNASQKEKVYEYLAELIVEFVRRHNITVIKPFIIGPAVETQIGLLSKVKERLGRESKDYLFAIEQDWILGRLELISPQFDFFTDRPGDMQTLAELKLMLGGRITKDLLKKLKKKGVKVDAVIMTSDICGPNKMGGSGPYRPSHIMDKFVYPYLKKEVKMFRELGIKYAIKHTDGDVLAKDPDGKTCLEKFIECGIDAFQAIEPYCLDIKKVKEAVLDKETGLPRICLIGGIDTAGLPLFDGSIIKTKEDFEKHIWYCLESASINGGYIPGATNDVSSPRTGQAAREKYRIFSEIKRKYGQYSLNQQGIAKIEKPKSED